VTQTNQVVWKDIVANAGPRVRPAEKSSPQVLARQKVLDALPRPDNVAAP
jgi:hypothetical protein